MGLFSFIRNEFIETIDWTTEAPNIMVHKFPDKGNKIMNGAMLTVRESQMAVLVNEGEFGDIYQAGLHKLTTENMPVLTTLESWKYAFNSPFKVDVFFINTAQFIDLKWGTQDPIILKDPEFKQVRVRARGIYSVRIVNPAAFITQFGALQSDILIDDIEGQLRHTIINYLTMNLGEANISVFDFAKNYKNIGDQLLGALQEQFEKFGLQLVTFFVENIGLPEEVEKFYDKLTQMNMVDSMKTFTQFQSAISIEKAAENENGGAGAFMGMATGVGLQGTMMESAKESQKEMLNTVENAANEQPEKIMELIKQLSEMKEAGILNEEEFASKKAELLKRI